jgi:AmmeMemoRadiSam system protein B/AmmeMemoRadiSam system protein A
MKILSAVFAVIVLATACPGAFAQQEKVRKAAYAGPDSFYPDNAEELGKQLDSLFEKAKDSTVKGEVAALMAPHAGYVFSGECAAFAYNTVKGRKFTRVVVIGPCHGRGGYYKGIAVSAYDAYATPLGNVAVDTETCKDLLKEKGFSLQAASEDTEHSIEVQMPILLKTLAPGFKVVPLIVGHLEEHDVKPLADTVRKFTDKNTLVVVSSDMTHFGMRFSFVKNFENPREGIEQMDRTFIGFIEKMDPRGMLDFQSTSGITVCGYRPIALVLSMLEPGVNANLLKYYMSADLPKPYGGDYYCSVSYAAVVFCREEKPKEKQMLTKEEHDTLLKIARDTIRTYLKTRKMPKIDDGGYTLTEALKRDGAAFVTLKTKDGRLRGCIGRLNMPGEKGLPPLYDTISVYAKHAAVDDGRFKPVTLDELDGLKIEISVLSPFEKITDISKIEVGRHGVYITNRLRSGVFLPQVATEQGWDRQRFLDELCENKAGLPPRAWEKNAELYIFSAEIFGEE